MRKPSAPGSRRTTIREVAEQVGVSISTVSHVFSGRRPISTETREKVLAAARALSYRPSAIAQLMRRGDTPIIGLVLRPRDATAGALRGTETFGRLIGATAAHVMDSGGALITAQGLAGVDHSSVPMDGCILAYPYGDDQVLTYLTERGIPSVTIDPDPNRPDLPWAVHTDYSTPMNELLEKLRSKGARRILLISGTEDNAWNRYSNDAYVAWMKRARMRPDLVRLYEGEATDGAERILAGHLASSHPPDAVITAASTFASGALKAIRARGLRVPQDILLAALTDSEYTRDAAPGITALNLRLESLADEAVRLLMARLAGQQPPAWPVVTPSFSWRASSG